MRISGTWVRRRLWQGAIVAGLLAVNAALGLFLRHG
jgi:hypothetical protein